MITLDKDILLIDHYSIVTDFDRILVYNYHYLTKITLVKFKGEYHSIDNLVAIFKIKLKQPKPANI